MQRFVPPLQGGGVCSAHDLGLGAARLTPGCHIAGFQPALEFGESQQASAGSTHLFQPASQRVLCICHRFDARLARFFAFDAARVRLRSAWHGS